MKMGETIHKQFTNTVMALSRVLYLLKDKFLARKLYQKLNDFTAGYIKFFVSKNMGGESKQEKNFPTTSPTPKKQYTT